MQYHKRNINGLVARKQSFTDWDVSLIPSTIKRIENAIVTVELYNVFIWVFVKDLIYFTYIFKTQNYTSEDILIMFDAISYINLLMQSFFDRKRYESSLFWISRNDNCV